MAHNKSDLENLLQHSILQLIGNTPLVKVNLFTEDLPNVEIYAKAEMLNPGGSIKDRPVLRMLTEAISSGELTKEKAILDSTSGNAAGKIFQYTNVGLKAENPESQSRKESIHFSVLRVACCGLRGA